MRQIERESKDIGTWPAVITWCYLKGIKNICVSLKKCCYLFSFFLTNLWVMMKDVMRLMLSDTVGKGEDRIYIRLIYEVNIKSMKGKVSWNMFQFDIWKVKCKINKRKLSKIHYAGIFPNLAISTPFNYFPRFNGP